MSDSNLKNQKKRAITHPSRSELSPWQARARAAGLQQKVLAEITGKSEIVVSHQLRGKYGGKGEPPRYVVAVILAWEMMSLEQREEWLALLGSKKTLPSEHFIRSRGHERLCEAVRHRREELELSREQVANAIGSTRFAVKDFEAGADVPLSFAIKIAEAVGLTFDAVSTVTASGVSMHDPLAREDEEYDITDSLPDDLEQGR